MNTKTTATIILIVGLSALIFLNTNSMSNNRYQPSNTSTTDTQSTPSRLRDQSIENLPTLTETLSELQTEVVMEGNTEETRTVQTGDRVMVNYTGWLASDGTIFDSSLNEGRTPYTFTVGTGVIDGWSQGVVGMQLGEIRRLKIPSELGYGESGQGTIPANADLIFDVELLEFK